MKLKGGTFRILCLFMLPVLQGISGRSHLWWEQPWLHLPIPISQSFSFTAKESPSLCLWSPACQKDQRDKHSGKAAIRNFGLIKNQTKSNVLFFCGAVGLRIWHCHRCGSGYSCGTGSIPDQKLLHVAGIAKKGEKKPFFDLRVCWEESGIRDQKVRLGQNLERFPSLGKLNSLSLLSILSTAKGE